MNSILQHPTSPMSIPASVWRNRHLLWQMTKREVVGRYRNSIIGMAWSFFHPLLMLAIYTFVFSVVFKARWGNGADSGEEFAVTLFVGMIIHGFFAECINLAPKLIVSNANYVKKVVFPLELLPVITLGAAFFHAMINFTVLLAALIFVKGSIPWTALLLPFVVIPFFMLVLGMAWFLASIGVFIRDAGQIVGIFTTILLFLSPVFYPISALPDRFQVLMLINPLTFIIEEARQALIWGQPLNWVGLCLYAMVALIVLQGGYFWFQKTRKGFPDAL